MTGTLSNEHASTLPPDWQVSPGQTDYAAACHAMEERVRAIANHTAPELIWLLQHPPLYTAGTSSQPDDLINANGFPVYQTGRGGQFTYHGPGQLVVYVMIDVKAHHNGDVRAFVAALEAWIIRTLSRFDVTGHSIEGRTGIWIDDIRAEPAKIAAIGLRVRHGISFHGLAINVSPDLSHFNGIVPCGLRGSRVTSLAALSCPATMAATAAALKSECPYLL